MGKANIITDGQAALDPIDWVHHGLRPGGKIIGLPIGLPIAHRRVKHMNFVIGGLWGAVGPNEITAIDQGIIDASSYKERPHQQIEFMPFG